MSDILLNCKSCKNPVALADLKADKSGSGWICLNCYKNQHPEIYKTKESLKPKEREAGVKEMSSPLLIKYYCSECGYKFTREKNFKGRCPYCNLYSVKAEKDADTLLRDSIDHIDFNPNNEKPRITIIEN